jgi:hypothetical protein
MFFLWQIRFVLLNIRLQPVQGLAIFKWPVCNKRFFYTVLSEQRPRLNDARLLSFRRIKVNKDLECAIWAFIPERIILHLMAGGGHNEGMESGATAPDVKVQGTTK